MEQVKITSFFNRIGKIDNNKNNNNSVNCTSNSESCGDGGRAYNPIYDSDTTIIYDYEQEIKLAFSSQITNKVIGPTSFAEIFKMKPTTITKNKPIRTKNKSTKSNNKDVTENVVESDDSNMFQPRRSARKRSSAIKLLESSDSDDNDEKHEEELLKKKTKKAKRDSKLTTKCTKKESTTNKENEEIIICIDDELPPNKVPVVAKPALVTQPPMKLWTQKYQPGSSAEMLGHDLQMNAAKEWLTTWGETFNSPNNTLADDDDDDEDLDRLSINGKCLYLYGPAGVGKTSLVYSIAKECGYKVLEYNATSLRLTPSLIQKELCESIQSYCIDKSNIFNFFANKKKSPSPPPPPLPLVKKRGRKPKNNLLALNENNCKQAATIVTKNDNNHCSSLVKLSKSLILFDDLDAIIYENKSCYELWRIIKSIITDSKKPIIITSRLNSSFLCTDLHYFTNLYLNPLSLPSMCQYLRRIYILETVKPIENHDRILSDNDDDGSSKESLLLLDNFNFDGDLRRMANTVEFWSFDRFDDNQFLLDHNWIRDSEMDSYIAADGSDNRKHLDLIELISMENILQTQFDNCLDKDCDGNQYNSHLYDKRISLLNTVNGIESHLPEHCATICNRFYHHLSQPPVSTDHSTIYQIRKFVDHINYHPSTELTRNNNNNYDNVDDYVAFFYSLIVEGGFPDLLREMDLMKKSKIISTRSKRNYSKFGVPSSLLC